MTDEQIKYLVDRFLGWRLPADFDPDAGITYKRPNYLPEVDATPSGTNLFNATQAEAMVRYMIDGLATKAEFKKQHYGAVVATILETDNSIVEVQERNDGEYGLIVHFKSEYRDSWDDLTAYLKPEHFEMLGSVARRMRGEQ